MNKMNRLLVHSTTPLIIQFPAKQWPKAVERNVVFNFVWICLMRASHEHSQLKCNLALAMNIFLFLPIGFRSCL